MIDEIAHGRLAPHLEPGERIVWMARPVQGFAVRPADAFLIPFSIVWLLGATNWTWEVFASGAPASFNALGLFFVLAGFYNALGRFVVDTQLRSQTYYGITNRRIVVIGGFAGKDVASFTFPTQQQVSIHEASDDRATVRFGETWPFFRLHATYWRDPEFFRVHDADTAANLLRNGGQNTPIPRL